MTGFETLGRMPQRVTCGDAIAIAFCDLSTLYPVALFTLQVVMKSGAGNPIVVDLTDDNGRHTGVLSFAAAVPGTYGYAIKAKRILDGAVRTVETGTIDARPDPANHDVRTHAEKVLAELEALIEGKASKDVSSYSIAGRSLTRMTPDELIKWRSRYRNEVAIQRNAGKPNGGRKITLARFQ